MTSKSSYRRLRAGMPEISRQRRVWLGTLLFLSFGLVTGDTGRGQEWKREWEATLAAARKEGRVNVYLTSSTRALEPFEKEYPEIRLVTVQSRGGDLAHRIFAERAAGKYLADVVSAGALNYHLFYRAGVLDPIRPLLVLPEATELAPGPTREPLYFDEEETYVLAIPGNARTPIQYNSNLVRPRDLASYWDLLQPKWHGAIVAYDPTAPAVAEALQFFYHHPELGPEFMRRFFGGMNVAFSRDFRQITDWLGRGRFALCFACRDVPTAKIQGLPVDELVHLKEGVYLAVGALSVLNRAPQPSAAKVFVNWFLSRSLPRRDRHAEGGYFIAHRAETADLRPIYQLTREIMADRDRN